MSEDEARQQLPIRADEHVAPSHHAAAFHCVWCGVLAQQHWSTMYVQVRTPVPGYQAVSTSSSRCTNCGLPTVWTDVTPNDAAPAIRMVFPIVGGGPSPHSDMPQDVRADYEEARGIVTVSPRGACALLRLATQKLVNNHLELDGSDLYDRIRKLVSAGLPVMIQQALDSLRVIGNEAVHPGELDLRDDTESATGLFMLLNVIVEDRITRPKLVAEMYAKLPAGKLQGIVQRDAPRT